MTSTNLISMLLLLAAAVAAQSCGTGLKLCGSQCYDPAAASCPTDLYTGTPFLCSVGYSACNKACFLPSQYSCQSGQLQQPVANPVVTSSPVVTPSTAVKATTSSAAKATTSSVAAANPTTSSAAKATTSSVAAASPTTSSVPAAAPTTSSAVKLTTSSAAVPTTSSSAAIPTTSSSAAAAATTSAAPQCNPAGCGSGLCNCNGACYKQSEYNCPVDLVTGKLQLCWSNFASCNGNCFDSSKQSCVSGSIVNGAATPAQPSPSTSSNVKASTSSQAQAATTASNPVVNPTPSPVQYPKQTADLRIINSCKTTLWFEARYGNAGAPIPGQTVTSQQALPGAYIDYTVPDSGLSGSRFWAKYGCDSNGKNCAIGDQMQYWPNPPGGCPANGCTPPVDSLFEATWGCRPGTPCNAQNPTTWFDTSQVDGWTIPYKLTPNGDTSGCDCNGSQCGFKGVDASTLDLAKCPQTENLAAGGQTTANVMGQTVNLNSVDLRIIKNNQVLGCMSPCKRLNWGAPYGLQQDEGSGSTMWMCCPTPTPASCSPANGCISPTACRAGPIENTQFVSAVHSMAPGVYSYSYDDGVGLHACPAGVTTYTMEFCPAGSAQYPLQL